MSELSKMTGVPWHVETLKLNEDDTRRHRARCIFYRSKDHYCQKWHESCRGSSHCDYYKERQLEHIEQKRKDVHLANKVEDRKQISQLVCDYEIGTWIKSDSFGVGRLVETSPGKIMIDFQGKQRCFLYPQAFDECKLFLVHAPIELKDIEGQDDSTDQAQPTEVLAESVEENSTKTTGVSEKIVTCSITDVVDNKEYECIVDNTSVTDSREEKKQPKQLAMNLAILAIVVVLILYIIYSIMKVI